MTTRFYAKAAFGLIPACMLAATATAMPPFGDWAPPANLESLPSSSPAINTPAVDGCASLSPDGLAIAYNSNRAGSQDIYVATRSDTSTGFGTPQRLPAPVNLTSADEFCPTIARGHRLYFSSTRTGDIGNLYVTRLGPNGWSHPTSLGPNINTSRMEESATFFEDERGREVMLFSRRSADGSGGDIFQSVDGGPPTLVGGGPDSSASDNRPSITHDGKTIFFDSTRFGTLGGPDLWYASRTSTSEPFGTAIHLLAQSSPAFDARANLSWDGTTLTYSSARAGSESAAPDIWYSTRGKATGHQGDSSTAR